MTMPTVLRPTVQMACEVVAELESRAEALDNDGLGDEELEARGVAYRLRCAARDIRRDIQNGSYGIPIATMGATVGGVTFRVNVHGAVDVVSIPVVTAEE